jgi:hypothetical protein
MEEKTARVTGWKKRHQEYSCKFKALLSCQFGARLLEASNFIFTPLAGP